MDLIADATLLVGLWRKHRWAVEFGRSNSSRVLGLPWVVLGEFWHGATRAGHDPQLVGAFLQTGLPIYDASAAIPFYARVCTQAQVDGFYGDIGQNDLWIAAVALANGLPLVSRNKRHFGKVEGLKLVVLAET
jgi:predicted nucleic acid-binding protein